MKKLIQEVDGRNLHCIYFMLILARVYVTSGLCFRSAGRTDLRFVLSLGVRFLVCGIVGLLHHQFESLHVLRCLIYWNSSVSVVLCIVLMKTSCIPSVKQHLSASTSEMYASSNEMTHIAISLSAWFASDGFKTEASAFELQRPCI